MKHAAVAWSFGKTQKSFYSTNRTPGPGNYNSPDVTMYRNKQPHWKLGTARRSYSMRENTPGPGNYNLKTSIGTAPKYTMRPKTGSDFNTNNKENPGPGTYDPNVLKKENYAYSLRIRPQTATELMKNPGPGTYNIRKNDNDFIRPHSYKFGHEKKHKEPDFTYLKSPGPGTYNFDNIVVSQAMPKFSFGKEDRGNNTRPKTPGPGTYEAKKVMGNDGPKISISNIRPNTGFKNENPGPGTYLPSTSFTKSKSPEYKIGTSKREIVDKETKMKPGPGTYNQDKYSAIKPSAPNWVFGSEERGNQANSGKENPGPGTYEIKNKVGEGPKVSLFFDNFILVYTYK